MPNFFHYNQTNMYNKKCCPLSKCHRKSRVEIVDLAMDRRLAHRCCELGLCVGNKLEILEAAGDVIISHNGCKLSLNKSMAQDILVAHE